MRIGASKVSQLTLDFNPDDSRFRVPVGQYQRDNAASCSQIQNGFTGTKAHVISKDNGIDGEAIAVAELSNLEPAVEKSVRCIRIHTLNPD